MALNLPNRYPGRFTPPSDGYPQGSFKNRTAPGALDGSYLEKDWANDKEGFFQSLIDAAGITVNDLPDEVGSSQYYDALLAVIAANNVDTLNTVRENVASASTVNLNTSAPDTRHINLTGTATITGFTVTTGRCYFVRVAATQSLVNSANLVTQRGENIICLAGDTYILRATADNVVEVLCYTSAIQSGLGYGQTLQNVIGSRSLGVNYTNTTGRTIWVHVRTGSDTSANSITITVGAESVTGNAAGSSVNSTRFVQAIVPPGVVYQVSGSTPAEWKELR